RARLNGNTLLTSRYDGDQLGVKLINKITEVDENIEQHRLDNFTGSMLKHHTMKSTQYMSQWIAAKNTNKDHLD
ncbi:MAG: glycosyltransferase, partial [Gammaproteobacteria bacterium]